MIVIEQLMFYTRIKALSFLVKSAQMVPMSPDPMFVGTHTY